jgi:hypothetical protein
MLAQGKPSTVPSPHLRKSALISPRRISGLRLVSVPRVHSVHSVHFVSIRVYFLSLLSLFAAIAFPSQLSA